MVWTQHHRSRPQVGSLVWLNNNNKGNNINNIGIIYEISKNNNDDNKNNNKNDNSNNSGNNTNNKNNNLKNNINKNGNNNIFFVNFTDSNNNKNKNNPPQKGVSKRPFQPHANPRLHGQHRHCQ